MKTKFILLTCTLVAIGSCRRSGDQSSSHSDSTKSAQIDSSELHRTTANLMEYTLAPIDSSMLASLRSPSIPSLPYILHDFCSDEYGCDYTYGIVESKIQLYSEPFDTLHPSFLLEPGDTALYNTQHLFVDRFRVIVFKSPWYTSYLADSADIHSGDTIVVLHHISEGIYEVVFNDRLISLEGCWSYNDAPATVLQEPHSDVWVSVTCRGKTGWYRQSYECSVQSHRINTPRFHTLHPHRG
jgi:hypothetical protein